VVKEIWEIRDSRKHPQRASTRLCSQRSGIFLHSILFKN